MRATWAICPDCDRWNVTPEDFKETKHFCRCSDCNGQMFIVRSDPEEAGYRDREDRKARIMLVKQ